MESLHCHMKTSIHLSFFCQWSRLKTCQKNKKDNEHVEDHSVQSIQGIHSSVLKDSIYYSSMQISQNCGAGSDKEKLVIHGKQKVNYKIWLIYNCNLVEILSIDRNGTLIKCHSFAY